MLLLGSYAARYSDYVSFSAPRSLRAGMAPGDNRESFSSARLPFTVPNNVTSVKLSLQYLPQSGSTSDGDRQYIGLLDSSGTYVASIVAPGLNDSSFWQFAEFDLQSYKGQTVYLYIGVKNDGIGNRSRIYADDISLTTCVE